MTPLLTRLEEVSLSNEKLSQDLEKLRLELADQRTTEKDEPSRLKPGFMAGLMRRWRRLRAAMVEPENSETKP